MKWYNFVLFAMAVMVLGSIVYYRKERPYGTTLAEDAVRSNTITVTNLYAGGSPPTMHDPDLNTHEATSAYDVSEGKRLYHWFNCSGCHANGGGDIGPPLMDDSWLYGAEPGNIYASILEGRPNGMPSFRGKIPDAQVWQLVAYVRSLSGNVPAHARPSRNDDISAKPPETMAPLEPMRQGSLPSPDNKSSTP
jgi:cytochrome c oxidase cbb3-type subunit 3